MTSRNASAASVLFSRDEEMIILKDSAVQSKISLLFQMERPYRITANDPGIMQLVDYDLSEAERQLDIWLSNHPHDCIQEARNPLTLKIFPTFFEDPEQKAQRTAFIEKRRYER